jgi:hypothetical protein
MKKLTILFCSLALVIGGVGLVNATSFTLSTINISLNQSDPGLVLWSKLISPNFGFKLNKVGDSITKDLFRIGTDETWSNSDDRVDLPISAEFIFSSPDFSGTNYGTTSGHAFLFASWGSVKWDDPVYFNFKTSEQSGQISLDLSDSIFGTPGSATINGNFTLTQLSDAVDVNPGGAVSVPEPETMLMLGFVLLGLVGVSRKRFINRN